MSCGCMPRDVNPARPGEPGAWVLPRSTSGGDIHVHNYTYRNTLGIVGGPIAKVCSGCGLVVHPIWAPAVPPRPALPAAAETFVVGVAEWVETRGVA